MIWLQFGLMCKPLHVRQVYGCGKWLKKHYLWSLWQEVIFELEERNFNFLMWRWKSTKKIYPLSCWLLWQNCTRLCDQITCWEPNLMVDEMRIIVVEVVSWEKWPSCFFLVASTNMYSFDVKKEILTSWCEDENWQRRSTHYLVAFFGKIVQDFRDQVTCWEPNLMVDEMRIIVAEVVSWEKWPNWFFLVASTCMYSFHVKFYYLARQRY